MYDLKKIAEITEPIVSAKGAFVVDLAFRGNDAGKVLEFFVDTDTGITTELCAEISRDLSQALDKANILQRRYHLVVSSPGIDRPLRFPRQYQKNIGRQLAVTYRGDLRNEKIEGELMEATSAQIVLRLQDGDRREIPVLSIIEARVKAAW
ncbi:MAG: hypothetical protein HYR76_10835 [Ignavibacteria bacterium]|nr:hypothetical protein [Ignavibacteria bacterium]